MFLRLVRGLRQGLLIDVVLLLSLVAATEQTHGQYPGEQIMSNMNPHDIVVCGPLVTDLLGTPSRRCVSGATKIDTRFAIAAGGGCKNSSSLIQRLGHPVRPIFMKGTGPLEVEVTEQLEAQFPGAVYWPCLAKNRLSVVLDPNCYVERAKTVSHEIPPAVEDVLRHASRVIVAPMTAEDRPFVAELLDSAEHSVLMLSSDQLQQRADCFDLMSKADVTVLNEHEAEQLLGVWDDSLALREFQLYGIPAVVVTSKTGATLFLRGRTFTQPAFAVDAVRRTVKAGDTFVGSLAVALAAEQNWEGVLDFALAACCVHVEGREVSMDAVKKVLATGERVENELPTVRRRLPVGLVAGVSATVAAIVSTMTFVM